MKLLRYSTFFLIFLTSFFIMLEANIKLGVISHAGYTGEREVAWRIKIAGERLGWSVYLDEFEGNLIKGLPLDLVICMLPENNNINPSCPNYLLIFHPFYYLDKARRLNSFYEKYDGYLLTIKDRETLITSFEQKNKSFNFIPFYPTVYTVPFKKVELNNLVIMIPVWSKRILEEKYLKLYESLCQTDRVKFYGLREHKSIVSKGFMGSIPFDGVSVINVIQENGIVLVFHSGIHTQEGIPTSRIFEAAAASAVIISDQNSFVKEHFGDSVFYIDVSLSGEEMFNQIQEHMNTIKNDPEKAWEMAKKAHQIFIEKFTMENQLLGLEKLHQKVMSERRK